MFHNLVGFCVKLTVKLCRHILQIIVHLLFSFDIVCYYFILGWCWWISSFWWTACTYRYCQSAHQRWAFVCRFVCSLVVKTFCVKFLELLVMVACFTFHWYDYSKPYFLVQSSSFLSQQSDPICLLLDEATAALDEENEQEICEVLKRYVCFKYVYICVVVFLSSVIWGYIGSCSSVK